MDTQHIVQLPPEVIGQIAAGEVVERPGAAIKELVENSIDAGATAVSVDIRDGGISYFRVTDNGKGIMPQDIRLAFARHATSKIRRSEDLYGVKTLGFRGEALASIAAVSKLQCNTRARGNELGISVKNEGGVIGQIEDSACPEGTTFIVKDLFFNAPVRRKFLKKPSVETAAVSDLMARMILSHPEISFRYTADGKTVYFSAGDGKTDSAVMSIFGLDTLKKLYPVDGHMNGMIVKGYVGVGELSRGNRSQQFFFLNGRLMKSGILTGALEYACRQRVMVGRFPICILYISMPFENVDVNVHPNKWEVRFQDDKAVSAAMENIVFDALNKPSVLEKAPSLFPAAQNSQPQDKERAHITVSSAIVPDEPQKKPSEPVSAPQPAVSSKADALKFVADMLKQTVEAPAKQPQVPPKEPVAAVPLTQTEKESTLAAPERSSLQEKLRTFVSEPKKTEEPTVPATGKAEVKPISAPAESPVKAAEPAKKQLQQQEIVPLQTAEEAPLSIYYIGTVFNTYILLECGEKMLLCDQHAAHERILYERFVEETEHDGGCQELLVPITVQPSPAQYAAFLENTQLLHDAGYDCEEFGSGSIRINGVPVILGQPQAAGCFSDTLDELSSSGFLSHSDKLSRLIQTACKHAVKGGEKLDSKQLIGLVRMILSKKIPPTCPHGRPLFVEVTRRDIEKRFKRIQD